MHGLGNDFLVWSMLDAGAAPVRFEAGNYLEEQEGISE